MQQEVIVGRSYGGKWVITNVESQNPKRITMQEACAEMAKYWRCTPENARESLEKHGYASSPNRDWRMAGRGVAGEARLRLVAQSRLADGWAWV